MSALLIVWGWLKAGWEFIAESRVAQAIAAVAGLLLFHRYKVGQAERKGAKTERKEAEQKATSRRAEIKRELERAREEAINEAKKQEADDATDPRDRFTRDPWG